MKKELELKPIVQSPNAKPVQMRATFDNQMKAALSLNVKNLERIYLLLQVSK